MNKITFNLAIIFLGIFTSSSMCQFSQFNIALKGSIPLDLAPSTSSLNLDPSVIFKGPNSSYLSLGGNYGFHLGGKIKAIIKNIYFFDAEFLSGISANSYYYRSVSDELVKFKKSFRDIDARAHFMVLSKVRKLKTSFSFYDVRSITSNRTSYTYKGTGTRDFFQQKGIGLTYFKRENFNRDEYGVGFAFYDIRIESTNESKIYDILHIDLFYTNYRSFSLRYGFDLSQSEVTALDGFLEFSKRKIELGLIFQIGPRKVDYKSYRARV